MQCYNVAQCLYYVYASKIMCLCERTGEQNRAGAAERDRRRRQDESAAHGHARTQAGTQR